MVICPSCKQEMEYDDGWCKTCGVPLTIEQQPDPQQSVPQQPDPQQSVPQQPDPQQPVPQQPDPQQSVYQQPDPQQSVPQQPDPQQPMLANFKSKISKLNPLSRKSENQQAIPQQAISQKPTPAISVTIGKLILPDQSAISINQIEKQFGREDFIRNVPGDVLKYISRNHFKISNENGIYYIEDTNSLGGTKLNTNEIKMTGKQQLNNGDKVFLGDSLELIFSID